MLVVEDHVAVRVTQSRVPMRAMQGLKEQKKAAKRGPDSEQTVTNEALSLLFKIGTEEEDLVLRQY